MDANGQRFWLLGDDRHWRYCSHARWDGACHVLRLASERNLPAPADPAAAHAAANSALEAVPRAVDSQGGVAHWNVAAGAVAVRSALPGEAVLLPLAATPGDLAVGRDGILYCVLPDAVRMRDLRGRWDDVVVPGAGFMPWRVATDPAGGLWLLERASGRLARLTGQPLPLGPYVDYAGTVFRPDPENCHPPVLRVLPAPGWPPGESPIALACGADGRLAILSWVGDGEARLRLYDGAAERLGAAFELTGARYAYAVDWLEDGRIAVRMPGRRDAPAFDPAAADAGRRIAPSGDVFPLAAGAEEAPFAHRLDGPPQYPVALADGVRGTEPLHPLSIANLARHGEARSFDGSNLHLVDSGSALTVWHRLFAEARLPARAGFIAWLAATNEPAPPDPADAGAWAAHRFGEVPVATAPQTPQAAWENAPSELPNHPGLGPWDHEPGRAGLLSVLIQDARRRVRAVVGRYLWVRVEMFGDGRVGPQIAALRPYASRFSYRDQYLPRLYRETVFGDPAGLPGEPVAALPPGARTALDGGAMTGELLGQVNDAGIALGAASSVAVERAGESWLLQDGVSGRAWPARDDANGITLYRPQATPADFLERLLGNFEGLLTPLEDRIANAHLLTDPAVAPEADLDWLAAWIGVAFDPVLPRDRRRNWLAAGPYLSRLHGTRAGLQMALDIATGGGVRSGAVVVLENFRLRRILATLLGVDLNEEDDPLLPGLIVSGNSVVGDTLALGERAGVELMALFGADLAGAAENARVTAFLDRLANRATVLVHQNVTREDLGLIRRIVDLEAPAHVLTTVTTATWPFLVGVASLVGVDTYLGPPRAPRPARADGSVLGQDFVMGPVALDPRLSGAAAPAPVPPPVADAGPDRSVPFGTSFDLDGSASSAAPGHSLSSYIWRRLPQT